MSEKDNFHVSQRLKIAHRNKRDPRNYIKNSKAHFNNGYLMLAKKKSSVNPLRN